MNEAQVFLMRVGLPDKWVGIITKTEGGMVVVDGGAVYVSDLMMAWAKRASSSNKGYTETEAASCEP